MEKRPFGKTGLMTTPVGFGAAPIGFLDVSVAEVDAILNQALDAGINVIDTGECYSKSEDLIGQTISRRRDEYVLISKWGHHVDDDDPADFSPELVRKSVERSLRRLKTDRLDALLVHSCDAGLIQTPMIDAMQECKSDGLVRFIGYSGENEAMEKALHLDVFDCIETSVNICDQRGLSRWLPVAHHKGLGVLAKRPAANTAWRDLSGYSEMYANYAKVYADRLKKMGIADPRDIGFFGDWIELALRFAAWQPGVSTILVGSKSLAHVRENIEAVEKGPLPRGIEDKLREAFKSADDGSWDGQI